jgi:hypothetical protein
MGKLVARVPLYNQYRTAYVEAVGNIAAKPSYPWVIEYTENRHAEDI